MAADYFSPAYEVIRNPARCTVCRVCEKQCANGVHRYDEKLGVMLADERQCVDCQRCVVMCPTRALKIVKSDNALNSNVNWTSAAMTEIYRQAQSGGVLLSSMGNPQPLPVYWDRLLINASQVTNPPKMSSMGARTSRAPHTAQPSASGSNPASAMSRNWKAAFTSCGSFSV